MKIEEICYGDYKAKINVSRGGNCISLRNSRYDCSILREPDYETGMDNPYLYGMPILFPVNRIEGGCFVFENRTYRFPINEKATNCFLHGVLHEEPLEIMEKEKNRIMLSYKATERKPYLTFPHEFEINMEYRLNENGLCHEVEICNLSQTNMPIMLGFHTTFQIPFAKDSSREDLCVRLDIEEEYERDMSVYLPTGKILDFDEISNNLLSGSFIPKQSISRHYRSMPKGGMSIVDKKRGISIVYNNCPEFAYRLIYSVGKDFICLEPQTCLVNCVNSNLSWDKTGFIYVKPGEKKKFWSTMGLKVLE